MTLREKRTAPSRRLTVRLSAALAENRPAFVLRRALPAALAGIAETAQRLACRHLKKRRFMLGGHSYPYFSSRVSRVSWQSERTVELPIVLEILRNRPGARVLEVGNVLKVYVESDHEVLDKHDTSPGIVREDICSFRPERPYGIVVCISTLEHVGWDFGEARDPGRALAAFEALRGCVAPGGLLVATVPLGYNAALDRMLDEGTIRFDRRLCLLRLGWRNAWREATWEEARQAPYDHRVPSANGLLIGLLGSGAADASFPGARQP
jgi:hypothetical protein